jgi:hypothetical protein
LAEFARWGIAWDSKFVLFDKKLDKIAALLFTCRLVIRHYHCHFSSWVFGRINSYEIQVLGRLIRMRNVDLPCPGDYLLINQA